MEVPENPSSSNTALIEVNADPSAGWVLQPDVPLVFELDTFTFSGVKLGEPADRLSFLGPAEDRALAQEGRLFYYSIGLEVLVEEGQIALYRLIWRDEAAEGFNPFPGRCVKHEPPVDVTSDTSELGIRRAFGVPYLKDSDNQGVVVFYEGGEYGWDVEFNLRGSIKQMSVYTPPLTEEEKIALRPRTEEEEDEQEEAKLAERTLLQEVSQLLVWPFLPYVLLVLAVVFGLTFQGVRRIYGFVRHGAPATAQIVRQEETPLQSGQTTRSLVYLYRDQKGQTHTGRVSAQAAQQLGRNVGDRFEITYDRRDPGDHIRRRVTSASIRTTLRNAALFVALAVGPVFLLTLGAAWYTVYQRKHPKPPPRRVAATLPTPMPFAPPPAPRKRRDNFWLIVQIFTGICVVISLQFFWTGINESRAYQRMWERGAPAEATVLRMVRVPAGSGVEEYEVTYGYADRNKENHIAATRARKQGDRFYIAYYQMTRPLLGRKWSEWVRAPELAVGKKLVISYFQDDAAVHLPFLMSEDLMGRPIMDAVRAAFSTVSTFVCVFVCFFGLGYLVTLKK